MDGGRSRLHLQDDRGLSVNTVRAAAPFIHAVLFPLVCVSVWCLHQTLLLIFLIKYMFYEYFSARCYLRTSYESSRPSFFRSASCLNVTLVLYLSLEAGLVRNGDGGSYRRSHGGEAHTNSAYLWEARRPKYALRRRKHIKLDREITYALPWLRSPRPRDLRPLVVR